MKKLLLVLSLGLLSCLLAVPAMATLISVVGPASDIDPGVGNGPLASIIAAPDHALDDLVTNTAMQGFDEAQDVTTSVAHDIDGGGSIAAGTLVDSHMIFLNSEGTTRIDHDAVVWTFSGIILGVMSDSGGTLEDASTFELGAPGTNYTLPEPGGGQVPPFPARGLETNVGGGLGPLDGYSFVGNTLTVSMQVTEPGDWIRVVTAVPIPSTLLFFGLGFAGFAAWHRRVEKLSKN